MMPPLAIATIAEAFWTESGMAPGYPRDIRRAVTLSQPISIVLVSALHVAGAEAWLRRQGITLEVDVFDRPLRACLVAHAGAGIIFLDGADPEDEQRYSIAHELAHFLVDYLAPRRATVTRLGEGIRDVLDGRRPARTEERIIALLTSVEVRPHVHLMSRSDDLAMSGDIVQSESMADALALELIAPWDDVSQDIVTLGITAEPLSITSLLTKRYGLPVLPAERYSERLCPTSQPTSPLLRHLRRVELAGLPRNTQ